MGFLIIQNVSHTGTVLAVQLPIFSKGFLLEKCRLIAPPCDADIKTSIRTFLIPGKTHHIGDAFVSHKDFDPCEQVFDILLPERGIPTFIPIKAGETVELHYGVAVLVHHVNLPFDQFSIRHIVEGENTMEI